MPSKLDIPSIDDIALLDSIIAERRNPNKTFFEGYKPAWVNRYEEYENNNGNPEVVSSSTIVASDKNKFINLYENHKGVITKEIIELLREHELSYCPFCSGLGVPDTLDHFLPKDIYPEYSIFSKNLIPSCDSCNRAKSTKVLDANGEKMFFHPYYDEIKDEDIYILDILPPYDKAPDFKLTVNDKLSNRIKNIAENQINQLKVESRFRKYFRGEYKRLKKEVLKNNNHGKIDLKKLLNIFYNKGLLVGINYWDTIFYKSVLGNDDLLDYLNDSEF